MLFSSKLPQPVVVLFAYALFSKNWPKTVVSTPYLQASEVQRIVSRSDELSFVFRGTESRSLC